MAILTFSEWMGDTWGDVDYNEECKVLVDGGTSAVLYFPPEGSENGYLVIAQKRKIGLYYVKIKHRFYINKECAEHLAQNLLKLFEE